MTEKQFKLKWNSTDDIYPNCNYCKVIKGYRELNGKLSKENKQLKRRLMIAEDKIKGLMK